MAAANVLHLACPSCLTLNRVPGAKVGEEPKCGRCGSQILEGAPVSLNEGQFDAFVSRSDLPVLVDFWAPWCAPCRAMAPAFEQAAGELRTRVRLAKVNTEESPQLAARFGIRAIPTLVRFEGGREAQRISGALDAATLVRFAHGQVRAPV